MEGTTIHCQLPAKSSQCTGRGCEGCGWNPKVAEARSAEIAANGLTEGPDGVRRLIIRKEAETYGGNE